MGVKVNAAVAGFVMSSGMTFKCTCSGIRVEVCSGNVWMYRM